MRCLLALPAFGGVEVGDGKDGLRRKVAAFQVAQTMLSIQAIARGLGGGRR
jgi:hypothetical protein